MSRLFVVACLLGVTVLPLSACGKRSPLTLPSAQAAQAAQADTTGARHGSF
jgi:predicted small lipoprotein YifL